MKIGVEMITPQARISTEGWTTCRNERYGYEFRYPPRWWLYNDIESYPDSSEWDEIQDPGAPVFTKPGRNCVGNIYVSNHPMHKGMEDVNPQEGDVVFAIDASSLDKKMTAEEIFESFHPERTRNITDSAGRIKRSTTIEKIYLIDGTRAVFRKVYISGKEPASETDWIAGDLILAHKNRPMKYFIRDVSTHPSMIFADSGEIFETILSTFKFID